MQIQSDSFVSDRLLEPTGLGCLAIVARHHGLHLTVSQLIHDSMLTGPEVSVAALIKSACGAGLRAKAVRLTWNGLNLLKKALPAIVRLEHGGYLVLLRLEETGGTVRLVLHDPDARDDASLLIDQVWFEKVWTGEVVLVGNHASNTMESSRSVPSDLRPGGQKTSDGVAASLAKVHPESRVRADKSHFRRTPNLGSSEPLVTRSALALAKETGKDIPPSIVKSPPGQIRARIGEAQTTANMGSTRSAPATSVATGAADQERRFSQTPTNLIPSRSSMRQFTVLTVGAAATVIVWASILTTQILVPQSIATLVQTNLVKRSNVDPREITKTNDWMKVDSDIGPKSKTTNLLSTNGSDAKRTLDMQSNQSGASTETPPAIEPKPLPTPVYSANGTQTKFDSRTMVDVQQLSNGDQISHPADQPPIQREINKTDDRIEIDSGIEPKSKTTNFLSPSGNDATRALDRQSNENGTSTVMPPAIAPEPLQTPATSVNRAEIRSNLKATADVQQLANGDRISRPEYQPPIQSKINKTNDQAADMGPKSKNTNFLSPNGNDARRALATQPNQRRASAENLPAMEPKSLRTPVDSVTRGEARLNLRTTADVQQVQQRLVELGYLPFLPDGVWGPHSIQALHAFRATAGLGSEDQWDRKTEDILFATTAPKATAPTASPLQLPPG